MRGAPCAGAGAQLRLLPAPPSLSFPLYLASIRLQGRQGAAHILCARRGQGRVSRAWRAGTNRLEILPVKVFTASGQCARLGGTGCAGHAACIMSERVFISRAAGIPACDGPSCMLDICIDFESVSPRACPLGQWPCKMCQHRQCSCRCWHRRLRRRQGAKVRWADWWPSDLPMGTKTAFKPVHES